MQFSSASMPTMLQQNHTNDSKWKPSKLLIINYLVVASHDINNMTHVA